LLALARGLRERGHRQTIVCPPDSALAGRARAEGFEITHRIPRSGEVVHAHSGRAHNAVLRATLGSGVRRVVTRHVAFAPRHPLVHRLKYSRTCHAIIAVSDAVRDALVRSGVPSEKIEVIHTGIDLPPLAPRRLHSGFVVGHLGAFTREKGQDVLIEAARALPGVRFLLGGEGPLLADLRRAAPANVEFRGFVTDTASFFAELDVFVMPSRAEAWGLAALEAMAHSLPVVASDIQGLREIVEPGGSGWLVPPGDADAVARAIAAAQAQPLDAYAAAARRRAGQFPAARMAEQVEALYLRLLS
jgi:glycosyltransferase involved in cell wall biosynthesis